MRGFINHRKIGQYNKNILRVETKYVEPTINRWWVYLSQSSLYVGFPKKGQKSRPAALVVVRAQATKRRAWNYLRNRGGYRQHLRYRAAKERALRIQRHCKREYESRITRNAKLRPNAYYNYVQSKAYSRFAVGNVVYPDGVGAASSKEKAEVLRSFFEKVHITDLGKPLPDLLGRLTEQRMAPFVLWAKEVEEALKQLGQNKAAGPDGLHPAILRPIADIIEGAPTPLCKRSLASATLPPH
ncbi:unnamed protein product [Echinostoma caproni]|uniref:Reverse transcriptase domain-containing protein n=1 Tax=Echinostoma caproni TaxID=27848 RepID=A0A183B866_9TREM|nr:unnamed protein product [Echinostoma caproni]